MGQFISPFHKDKEIMNSTLYFREKRKNVLGEFLTPF